MYVGRRWASRKKHGSEQISSPATDLPCGRHWVGNGKKGHGSAPFPRHRSSWTPYSAQTHVRPSSHNPLSSPSWGQCQPAWQISVWTISLGHRVPHCHKNKALAMFWVGVKTHPTYVIYKESSWKPLSNLKNKLSFKVVLKANDPSWTLSFC